MKRFLAILAAMTLLFAAIPALAFTGYTEDPGDPSMTMLEEPPFDIELRRVENDPETSENNWGETIYIWHYMEDDAPIAAGDTVTFSMEIEIPEEIDGVDEESANDIKVAFFFVGLDELEIVTATGADANYECDYDAGYCYPLPGYGNIEIEDGVVTVHPHLGSVMQIVVRGEATADSIDAVTVVAVGQTDLPAYFSVGKLVAIDGGYYVYYKDLFNVQIRGMKFFADENDNFDHYYVCLNDHDYVRSEDGSSFTMVEDPSVVYTEGDRFEALTLAYETYMNFFGFTDDGVHDLLTDNVFLADCHYDFCVLMNTFGGQGGQPPVDPTEPPVDPTEPPVDPTEPPVDPTPVTPPQTGAVSLAAVGVIAALAGAGIVVFRRKK